MTGNQTDLSVAGWRASSYSNTDGGNCIEVAGLTRGVVPVRDSKRRAGPVVAVGAQAWSAFISLVRQNS